MIGRNFTKHRLSIIILAVLAAVFFVAILGNLMKRPPAMSNLPAAVISTDVIKLTNKKRSENHFGFLKYNFLLSKAAQLKAEDMAKRGYFSHQDPDGLPPWKWLDQVGYDYTYAGENLGLNFFESKKLIDAWLNSSLHRLNLLNKNYTEIGIGVASGVYDGRPAVFIVQFLSKPNVP